MTRRLRPALVAAALFSVAFNILLLVSPLYMLQVYDRVLTSGSIDTLLLLSFMAVGLLGVFAAADSGRRRVFALIGRSLGQQLEPPLFAAGMASTDGGGRRLEGAVADLGRVQALFSAGTIQPLFDAPFVPMFAICVFLVHPLLGALTLGGAVGLVVLAVFAERAGSIAVERSTREERSAARFLAGISRQFGVVRAMGMSATVEARWRRLRDAAAIATLDTGRTTNFYGGISKSVRQMLQVATLGTAAWLVLQQEISSGAIIASSILTGRCLAPIDQAIGAWKPFLQARKSWRALADFLPATDAMAKEAATPLPAPEPRLRLRDLAVGHPADGTAIFSPVDLDLSGGQTLLVLGRSGQGKTSFLQVLSGAWVPLAGTVSLGGRDLHQWDPADRGAHIGYLPQYVDLLPGTVAENIVRFRTDPPETAIAAAQRAGCHEAILTLSGGYDTPVGVDAPLSAGQRQEVGLARAVYGEPVVLFLDEPTAHLDLRGVTALLDLLRWWQEKGRIAVIASHDRRLLAAATLVMELRDGRAILVERDVYARALAAALPAARPQKVNS